MDKNDKNLSKSSGSIIQEHMCTVATPINEKLHYKNPTLYVQLVQLFI